VLRALAREPETRDGLLAEMRSAAGIDATFDAALAAGEAVLSAGTGEAGARALVERLALLLQAAVLLRAGNPLARDWCASRLGGARGDGYGTLAAGIDLDAAIARSVPG
jgi:putative acyl-CoA dehydrogenase